MKVKLSKWAKENGVCYHTAYRWFKDGRIPNSVQLETGTILIEGGVSAENNSINHTVIYARVSNQSRKAEIEYQVERLVNFANARGLEIDKIYKEVASGMNDNRKQFWKMIDASPSIIIVEHKDRLTRFGFNYLERLLKKQNCDILVMNRDANDETDLIKDLVSVVTSFCCRLYGLRRGINKAKKIKKELNDQII